MNAPPTPVEAIPVIGHDEAMDLAAAEYDRLLTLADDLQGDDWSRQTDCTDWDVRAMLGHMLGMLELQADSDERMRQGQTAAATSARTGGLRPGGRTAAQVDEPAALTPGGMWEAPPAATP